MRAKLDNDERWGQGQACQDKDVMMMMNELLVCLCVLRVWMARCGFGAASKSMATCSSPLAGWWSEEASPEFKKRSNRQATDAACMPGTFTGTRFMLNSKRWQCPGPPKDPKSFPFFHLLPRRASIIRTQAEIGSTLAMHAHIYSQVPYTRICTGKSRRRRTSRTTGTTTKRQRRGGSSSSGTSTRTFASPSVRLAPPRGTTAPIDINNAG